MDNIQKPPTLKELRNITPKLRKVSIEHQENLSSLDKAAIWVTDRVGTMGFFLVIAAWTIVWLAWNTAGPSAKRFDPYPAFVLWLFISNMIQLFLLPLLLIGQNLEEKYSEKRSEIEFDINVKAEKEIEAVLTHLEYQNSLILKILEKMEKLEIKNNKKKSV